MKLQITGQNSFFAYRLPRTTEISYGESTGIATGLSSPGFVIGMFSPDAPIITIPFDGKESLKLKSDDAGEFPGLYNMPEVSTDYADYSREVEAIVAAIKSGKGDKVVAARVVVTEETTDVSRFFRQLCDRFPDAFVFCFSTPITGCWIGASPELLLEGRDSRLHSMALAGTRPAGSPGAWDAKNIEEQAIVTEYICNLFDRHGYNASAGEPFTKQAGLVEHICTLIEADASEAPESLESLIRDLSPTPALCGQPKEFGLQMIAEFEHFDRGCYGGFCGPFFSPEDFRFNVILRCASLSPTRFCRYAGGGITALSSVPSEWSETELKLLQK